MNYNEEPYPEDVSLLLKKADAIAGNIKMRLNDDECPKLKELFYPKNDKNYRDKKPFEKLDYIPNIDSKTGETSSNDNEFKGLYVFGEEVNHKIIPVYIGISRTVYRRLRQHGFGKRHNECSLAYLMAKHENSNIERANIHKKFEKELIRKKEIVKSFKVALFPIEKDYELYFLEVALAAILKTKWNSFRTH